MKFVVDKLPYFGGECHLGNTGDCYYFHKESCPRNWDEKYVCSNDNPRECEYLIEGSGQALEPGEWVYQSNGTHFCVNCGKDALYMRTGDTCFKETLTPYCPYCGSKLRDPVV